MWGIGGRCVRLRECYIFFLVWTLYSHGAFVVKDFEGLHGVSASRCRLDEALAQRREAEKTEREESPLRERPREMDSLAAVRETWWRDGWSFVLFCISSFCFVLVRFCLFVFVYSFVRLCSFVFVCLLACFFCLFDFFLFWVPHFSGVGLFQTKPHPKRPTPRCQGARPQGHRPDGAPPLPSAAPRAAGRGEGEAAGDAAALGVAQRGAALWFGGLRLGGLQRRGDLWVAGRGGRAGWWGSLFVEVFWCGVWVCFSLGFG